jgi:hypothetical protein
MRNPRPASPDPELTHLQEVWSAAWAIWRARRSCDPPGVHNGDFVATRIDEEAGPDRTVMAATAEEMDQALRRQRDLAGYVSFGWAE